MANVITQFLIGLGYETSDLERGERRAKQGMEGIKSSALAIGASMTAAAIGAGVQVDAFAQKAIALDNKLYRTGTSTTFAQGYGAALQELGGNADEASDRVRGLEENIASIFSGQGGGFLDALSQSGFNVAGIQDSRNAQEAMTNLADQFSKASHTQQLNMARALGLSDAEVKLWQRGGQYLNERSQQLADHLGYTEALLAKQRDYNDAVIQSDQAWTKVTNTVSSKLLPSMTELRDLSAGFGNWVSDKIQSADERDVVNATTATAIVGGQGASMAARAAAPGLARFIPGVPFAGPAAGAVMGDTLWKHAITPMQDELYGPESTGTENFRFKKESPLGIFYDWLQKPTENNHAATTPDESKPWLQKPTHGAEYAPYSMPPPRPDYERQGEHITKALRDVPLSVKADVKVTNRVELDGQKIGEVIDTRIDQHNVEAMNQTHSEVDR
ncbi:hypothetical protein N3S92_004255 [Cronobacter sakazakii]|nr:hypothetical protein [Cronobacter sakazakii]KAB0886872.1 hypothetical protein FZI56_21500 [Cronobacter sakazakii]